MALFNRFRRDDKAVARPLYHNIIAEARNPVWYRQGGVADSIDGRFDMVALVMALVLLRLEQEGQPGQIPSVRLTEVFVEDMEGQVREIGFGDLVVGKQIGRIMAALGGRLGAYRPGLSADALIRNLYRGAAPAPSALAFTLDRGAWLADALSTLALSDMLAGRWPTQEAGRDMMVGDTNGEEAPR